MQQFSFSRRSVPVVVKNLIIINVIMFAATWLGNVRNTYSLTEWLALYFPASTMFEPYQLVTHMFMHAGFMHLFFNMFALWMFGRAIEMTWGSKRFLLYFFVTGLGAAGLHMLVRYFQYIPIHNAYLALSQHFTPEGFDTFVQKYFQQFYGRIYNQGLSQWLANPDNLAASEQCHSFLQQLMSMWLDIPTVGASGAVFGVLLAFGMLYPNTMIYLLIPPIPIKAKWFVMFYGALELYLGFSQQGSNVAHFAHVGGMLFGFLLIIYWRKHGSRL